MTLEYEPVELDWQRVAFVREMARVRGGTQIRAEIWSPTASPDIHAFGGELEVWGEGSGLARKTFVGGSLEDVRGAIHDACGQLLAALSLERPGERGPGNG
jgi:hypothetical protein